MAFLKVFVPQNMKDLKKEAMELEKRLNHRDIFSTVWFVPVDAQLIKTAETEKSNERVSPAEAPPMGASITLCRAAPVSVFCKDVMNVLVLELLTKESEEETPSQVTVNLFKALEKIQLKP